MRSEGRREPWPWILAAMLLSMMSISIGFYAVAASNPDPLVVDDAYEAGLRYNELLRAQQRGEALGYRVDLALDPGADTVRVQVVLRDAAGRAVRPEAVSVRRIRCKTLRVVCGSSRASPSRTASIARSNCSLPTCLRT